MTSSAKLSRKRAAIRDLFLQMTPELRKRAAEHGSLLTDFEFRNVNWWRAVRQFLEKPFRGTAWRNPFPKRAAVPLTRATLMLAWQAVRINRPTARIVLGIADGVAEVIGALQLTEIDRIADRHHRQLEPRWADRHGVWCVLLSTASAPSSPATRHIDTYGLQLLTGDLLPEIEPRRQPAARRPHPVSTGREP